jgi:16S rRNA (cytidine1402-2'-O)-methyltransferase
VSKIFIIPTPIGNLGDITYRAVETLKKVNRIYAEDTRTSKKLLSFYNIETKVYSYHQHNEHKIVDQLVNEIKEENISIALISDAGTPGISDPGFLLINRAKQIGITVFCLPGATALIPAVVQSGFSTDQFYFFGFLPHKKGRQKKIKLLLEKHSTIVLYESPHRLMKLLLELKELDSNNRNISISREISKIHEESVKGNIDLMIKYFSQKPIKGEIVVVIDKIDQKSN